MVHSEWVHSRPQRLVLDPSFLVSLYNIAKVQLVVIDSLGEDQKATLEIAKLIKDESLRT